MAYIGFDLDETLGRFSVPEFHTYFLNPKEALYESQWSGRHGRPKFEEPPYPDSLKQMLDQAFELFVDCLVEKEKQGLGLLRPGIVEMARTLHLLKQTTPPQVKSVVIYSNNGNMALLKLAGKMIERLANAPGLFCNYINWFHPSREGEVVYGDPGKGNKTIQVLLEAFQTGSCSSEEPRIENVYFFDDTSHDDIASQIGNRYFLNPAYKYDANPKLINECFKTAFEGANLASNPDYWTYIRPTGQRSYEQIVNFILEDQRTLRMYKIRPNNTNFRKRFNQTFRRPSVNQQSFQRALQTTRRLEQKLNKGATLTSNEEQALSKARNTVVLFEEQNPNTAGGKRSRKSKKQKRRSKN